MVAEATTLSRQFIQKFMGPAVSHQTALILPLKQMAHRTIKVFIIPQQTVCTKHLAAPLLAVTLLIKTQIPSLRKISLLKFLQTQNNYSFARLPLG